MNKYIEHFKTITLHKLYVGQACFKAGIPWQGITHDLSKYGLTEFKSSAKYFQGDRSPIKAEKDDLGYSIAWQHHKGVNKHHWQYWIDWKQGKLYTIEMPYKHMATMICDWIGAGKAYNKGEWSIYTFRHWYANNENKIILHEKTREIVRDIVAYSEDEQDIYEWLKFYKWKDKQMQKDTK